MQRKPWHDILIQNSIFTNQHIRTPITLLYMLQCQPCHSYLRWLIHAIKYPLHSFNANKLSIAQIHGFHHPCDHTLTELLDIWIIKSPFATLFSNNQRSHSLFIWSQHHHQGKPESSWITKAWKSPYLILETHPENGTTWNYTLFYKTFYIFRMCHTFSGLCSRSEGW